MKPTMKTFGVSTLLLTLTGCADFQLPQLPQLPTLPSAPAITDSVDTICKEFKANEIRGKKLYAGKAFSTNAKLGDISEAVEFGTYYPTYMLSFWIQESRKENDYAMEQTIHAEILQNSSSGNRVSDISNGENLNISGIIDSVKYNGKCTIFLKRTSFSK